MRLTRSPILDSEPLSHDQIVEWLASVALGADGALDAVQAGRGVLDPRELGYFLTSMALDALMIQTNNTEQWEDMLRDFTRATTKALISYGRNGLKPRSLH